MKTTTVEFLKKQFKSLKRFFKLNQEQKDMLLIYAIVITLAVCCGLLGWYAGETLASLDACICY